MINITSVTKTGEIKVRQYDNKTAKFFENGEPIILTVEERAIPSDSETCSDGVPASEENAGEHTAATMASVDTSAIMTTGNRPFEQIQNTTGGIQAQLQRSQKPKYQNRLTWDGKSRDLQLLKIQLGLGCNYDCSYCKQAIHVQDASHTNLDDAEEFIANFDTWCQVPREDRIRIELWGGEPFVYFKKIKLIVPFLRQRFDHADISILSNGSLINEAIVTYLIENNVSLAISHDGPGTLISRTGDPLEEGSKSLYWIKEYVARAKKPLYLNSVLSKPNHDPFAITEHIYNILGRKNVIVGFEGIVNVEDEGQFDEKTMFTEEDYYEMRMKMKQAALFTDPSGTQQFNSRVKTLIQAWTNPYYQVHDQALQKCGMDSPYTMAVDLKGNALVCHSVNTKIGNVYDDFDGIKMSNGGVLHWNTKEECRTCPVLNLCWGSCMNLHENSWYYTCNNEFHYNMAFFEAAFEVMFNEQIIEMDGFVRPKKKKVFNIVATGAGGTPCKK